MMSSIINRKFIKEVPKSFMEKHWKCQICLQIVKNPKTIPECLHSFCKICIEGHLKRVKKCPICNVEVSGKGVLNLRTDHIMDSIFKRIIHSEVVMAEEEEVPETEPEKPQEESSARIAESKNPMEAKTGLTEEEARNLKGKQKMVEQMSMVEISDDDNTDDDDDDDDDFRVPPPVTKPRGKRGRGRPKKTLPVRSDKIVSVQPDNGSRHKNLPGIWMKLIPSENQERKYRLDDINVPFLRIKNVDQTVLLLQKYLKLKLNLESEDEVEISLSGKPLDSTTKLYSLIDMYPRQGEIKTTIGASAGEFVMTVSYSRK